MSHRAISNAVEFHDSIAGDWEQKYCRPAFLARELALMKCFDGLTMAGQRWLDAGCGTGRLSRLAAQRGCHVHGIDASPGMIRFAAEMAAKSELAQQLSFDRIDSLDTTQLSPAAYDGVLCISVLEYLASPIAALKNFASALRPGGVLVAAVPNRRSFIRRMLLSTYQLTKAIRGSGWPGYLQFSRHEYSRIEFAQLLESAGFGLSYGFYFGGPIPGALQTSAIGGSLFMCVARKR